MPFKELIFALAYMTVFCGCAGFVIMAIYRLIRYKRISTRLAVVASLALLPLSAMIVAGVMADDIEHNPWISSSEQLVGTYSKDNRTLVLRSDGTYSTTGFAEMTAGTWTNYDWNLTLSNSGLKEPRVVTCNGILNIAPFYNGVDGPIGVLLKKQGGKP